MYLILFYLKHTHRQFQPVGDGVRVARVLNSGKLSVLYYNARSIYPRLDSLTACISVYVPDVVCIVESWLDEDMGSNEILLPNFVSVRLHRNRHGGGVFLWIRDNFAFKILNWDLLMFLNLF